MSNRAASLLSRAQLHGDRTAILFGDRRISFAELGELTCETAGGLRNLGIRSGTRVGVMIPSQPEFIIVEQALFLLGAVVSPINVYYRPAELAHAVRTCEIEHLVIANELRDRLPAQLRHEMPSLAAAIVADGGEDTPEFRSLRHACGTAKPVTEAYPVSAEDVVMLLNTSATTGKSKGVMLTAGNLAANYDRTPDWLGLRDDDVILCALPLYNTFGLNQCINAMTSAGATLVLLPRFDAEKCIQAIHRHRCTFLPGVPTMLQKVLDQLDCRTSKLDSLQLIMTGGAPVPAPLLARLKQVLDPAARVLTGYGLTEATALVTLTDVELDDDGTIVRGRTIGRVLDGMSIGAVDEQGLLLGPGETGEFVVRGPNLMAGYYCAPADTAAALQDGALHTGDIGYLDADGFAYIVDRKKDIIIRGGQNIYPADIEEVLYGVDGVAEAAVIGAEDALFGEVPVAYVALSPHREITEHALLARCSEELAAYKQPVAVHFLPELPKGPTGKILRRELRRWLAEAAQA
jgi:long-chain acyl-CoA synthetase